MMSRKSSALVSYVKVLSPIVYDEIAPEDMSVSAVIMLSLWMIKSATEVFAAILFLTVLPQCLGRTQPVAWRP